jgi:hypothetical protein
MATDNEFGDGEFGSDDFGDMKVTEKEQKREINIDNNEPAEPATQPEPAGEHELFDLKVVGEDITLDDSGDLATVSGIDNVAQSAALDVRDELQYAVGDTLTTDAVYDVQQTIHDALAADPQLATPVSVTLESISTEGNELTFSVECLDNEDFTLDMVLPDDE